MKVWHKRIGFLVLLSLILVLVPLGLSAPQAQPTQVAKLKLRFSGIHPPMSLPSRGWKFWMDKVTEKTNGRIIFEPYWSASLLSLGEIVDGTGKGLADAASGVWIFDPGKMPLGSFETSFLFNDPDHRNQSKIKRQMFDEIPALNAELAKWNLGPATYFTGGTPYDLLTKKPVKTLADLKGMRIGHTPVELVPAFREAGAASVVSPAPEFYSRLERGLVDGICLPINLQGTFKLYEVAKYHTAVALNTGVFFTTYINLNTWKKLSPQDQQIFRDAAKEAEQFYMIELDKEVATFKKTFQDAGVQFLKMPADDIKKWASSIPDIPAQWAKKMESNGLPGWQIVDKYLELSKKADWEFPRKWGVR
jgi:TRAP-type C4-dicarboxylate transport system substrate-binding protein